MAGGRKKLIPPQVKKNTSHKILLNNNSNGSTQKIRLKPSSSLINSPKLKPVISIKTCGSQFTPLLPSQKQR